MPLLFIAATPFVRFGANGARFDGAICVRPKALRPCRPERLLLPRACAVQAALTRESVREYLRKYRQSDADERRVQALLDFCSPADAMLLLASRLNDHSTVRALIGLDFGRAPALANVNVQDTEGSTPLMRAASRGHVAVAEALLQTGRVDLSVCNKCGYDAFTYVGSVRLSLPEQYAELMSLIERYKQNKS